LIDHHPDSSDEGNTAPESRGDRGTNTFGRDARRILLISPQDAVAERLRAALKPSTVEGSFSQVRGDLMALGQIGTRGAPDVIIARSGGLADSAEATAAALRQLAPRARLVFLTRDCDASTACRAIAAGFDDHLPESVETAQLHEVVFGDRDDPGETSAVQPPTRGADGKAPRGEGDPMIDHALGDVDLIERMLNGRTSIRDLAVKMIRRESGVEDFGWQSDRKSIPKGRAVAEITYQKRRCGFLHAPRTVQTQTLASWAGWLGRWMAMEQHTEELWHMAMTDELTSIWNRRYFQRFLESILDRAVRERFNVTLMVFDIDDFKTYNDRYGHAAGDEILRETARLMVSVVRQHDVVSRIGGDEFAVVFWDSDAPRRPDSHHPHDVVLAARRFQQAICDYRFPKLTEGPATLSISGGLAGFPWDGHTPQDLLQKADEMSIRSKQQGKNALTFGPGAQRVCQFYSDEPQQNGGQVQEKS